MRATLFTLALFVCSLSAAAQNADLVISNINFPAASYNKGERMLFSFSVKNTGAGNAAKSFTKIYLSNSFSYTDAVQIGYISCKALMTGEESPEIKCAVALPYSLTAGNKYLLLKADANNEVTETNEVNDFHSAGTETISSAISVVQNLPYPVIFIHGFVSSNTTWDDMKAALQNNYGLSYGGNMNFCLNQDNNTATSNAATDYHDWTNISSLAPADFYTVNFDTDPSGNTITNSTVSENLESNQAGVVKQGLAIRDAIKHVLQITGRDKVVLCGHSMGGLSSREYLQNSSIWQADGQHHVAKLTTLGTPHGGTNLTGLGLGGLGGLDEYSEAVRDLRTSYFWSGEPGVYLFGGRERYNVMQYYPFFDYVNVDVNCNGIDADNSLIAGINSKSMPADIAYTCVIGNASGSGDYVVSSGSANLNNYRSVNADTFMVDAIHTSLTSQIDVNIKSLDESKNSATAYTVAPDKIYTGMFTPQSVTAPSASDSDYFRFSLTQTSYVRSELMNIAVRNATVKIYDGNNFLKYSYASNGAGYTDNTTPALGAGNYFINIAGVPDATSAAFPYAAKLSFLQVVPLSLLRFDAALFKENFVALNWEAANEGSTAGYELQRSEDAILWNTLFTKTALNSNAGNTYSTIDSLPKAENFYRLKIKDLSGGFTYSEIKKVSFKNNAARSFSVSPNPSAASSILAFNSLPENAIITINDMQGREIFRDKVNAKSYQLNTMAYPAGVYVVSVANAASSFTSRLLVIK